MTPWHSVTTDYITGLPLTVKGHNVFAVFVVKLTKYVYAVPCSNTSDATDWAHMYVEHVVQHQGLSEVIISDRGPQFISIFNKALGACLGIKWNLSTARHRQVDGQTERVNRVIENVMRYFVSPNMLDWDSCCAWLNLRLTMHGMRPLSKLLSFFFFLGGKDIHYTSAMIATSRVCDVHHKPKRPKLTTHLEWFRHEP